MKVSFGYDVPILMDYTDAKNEPSEHVGSGEMSIGANFVKIRICRKNCRLLAVFNMTLLYCIFSSVCQCTPDYYFSTYSIVHVEALKYII
jgi:hypothetical protein